MPKFENRGRLHFSVPNVATSFITLINHKAHEIGFEKSTFYGRLKSLFTKIFNEIFHKSK